MAALGMDMAIVPAIAVGSSDVATDECPLGHFRSFYYQSGLKCVLSETPYDAGLLSKATAAFASRNISVYIGLAEPEAPFHQPWNRTGEALTLPAIRPVPTYEVAVIDGDVVLTLAPLEEDA